MNFFFAKLFEEYERKHDSPSVSIVCYISVFYFFHLFALLLPISETINKIYFNDHPGYNKSVLAICVFTVSAIILFIVHTVYIRNSLIFSLKEKYADKKINRTLLYLLVVAFPLAFMLLGAFTTVFLKGGTILNHSFKGII